MANRYWVGGTGSWSDTANWATSSGGAGGASEPGSSDNVYFDAASFSADGQTVTLTGNENCADFDASAIDQEITFENSGATVLNIYGSALFSSSLTLDDVGVDFENSSDETLTLNGFSFGSGTNNRVIFKGSAKITLQDDFQSTGLVDFEMSNGTFDANGYNFTCGYVTANSNTKTIYAGEGTWNISIAFGINLGSNTTFYGEGAIINSTLFTSTGSSNTIDGGTMVLTLSDGINLGGSGSNLDFSGTTITTQSSGSSITGGTVDFTGATLVFAGTEISGGTVDFTNAALTGESTIEFTGGSFTFSGTTFKFNSRWVIDGATIDFSNQTLVLNDELQLDSGSLNLNNVTLSTNYNATEIDINGGTLTFTNLNNVNVYKLDVRNATVDFSGTSIITKNEVTFSNLSSYTMPDYIETGKHFYGGGHVFGSVALNSLGSSGDLEGNNTFTDLLISNYSTGSSTDLDVTDTQIVDNLTINDSYVTGGTFNVLVSYSLTQHKLLNVTATGPLLPLRSNTYVDRGGNTGFDYIWINAGNALVDDNNYASIYGSLNSLSVKLSKTGLNGTYSSEKTLMFSPTISEETAGDEIDTWSGFITAGEDINNSDNFVIKLFPTGSENLSQSFTSFSFGIPDAVKILGFEVVVKGKWDSNYFNIYYVKCKPHIVTSQFEIQAGSACYVSDGRKEGESEGQGTGALVFYDENGSWIELGSGQLITN